MPTSTPDTHHDETRQTCPACGTDQPANPRYPQYVCKPCRDRATDITGNRLSFYNAGLDGGMRAEITGTGEVIETARCFIDGRGYSVREGYFGGIVIEPEP